jgi:hypothetical protein
MRGAFCYMPILLAKGGAFQAVSNLSRTEPEERYSSISTSLDYLAHDGIFAPA